MMRNKLTYLTVMILVIGACATATQSDPTSTPEPSSSGTPTTSEATVTNAAGIGDTSTTTNGAIEIRLLGDRYDTLDPGPYWVDHDANTATSLRVDFTIAKPGWGPLIGANKQAGESFADNYVALHFFAIDRVATAACYGTEVVPAAATAEGVANQLAEIKDFEIVEPVAKVDDFGFTGYHLILAVPEHGFDGYGFSDCDDGRVDSWRGPTFSRYYQGPGQVVEFWVVDVEGTPLGIEATWFPDSPPEDIAELRDIIDTVTITP